MFTESFEQEVGEPRPGTPAGGGNESCISLRTEERPGAGHFSAEAGPWHCETSTRGGSQEKAGTGGAWEGRDLGFGSGAPCSMDRTPTVQGGNKSP